jgi:hypothetical protein
MPIIWGMPNLEAYLTVVDELGGTVTALAPKERHIKARGHLDLLCNHPSKLSSGPRQSDASGASTRGKRRASPLDRPAAMDDSDEEPLLPVPPKHEP